MRTLLFKAVATLTTLAALPACDDAQSCTLIGCAQDALVIELVGAAGEAPPGSYRVTVTTPEGTRSCELTLPFVDVGSECRTNDGDVSWWGFAPAALDVVVTRDGATVYSGSHSLSYTTSRPNGEGCGPVCRAATLALVVD